jgi:Signal transduction histidine kinase
LSDAAVVRLLYVDDDEGLSRLVQKTLGRLGYDVTTCASGAEGLERLGPGTDFDAVALDHYMPGQEGLEILPQIVALPDAPPVIYVTGAEDGRIAVAALKAGASEYVIKDASGQLPTLLDRAITEALRRQGLTREKDAALEQARLARDRAEALLREVNHRVGNSLQLVSSFMSLQLRQLSDEGARQALREAQTRIEAVAHVHRRLYTSGDTQTVSMLEYLEGLVEELQRTLSAADGGLEVRLTSDPIQLSVDEAVSVGVIVSELVTNAAKYAYDEDTGGEVRVRFERCADQQVRLTVEDDGHGMGDGTIKGTGLGSRIITAMAAGLRSRVEFDPEHRGVRAGLSFTPMVARD